MNIEFNQGFTVYKEHGFDLDLVFVAPHSGPALEVPTSRDDSSETVASLAWLNLGGTLVVSNCSRKPLYGIDMNRKSPSMEDALKHYPAFLKSMNQDNLYEYRRKYAWVAKDKRDFHNRNNIYKNYWNTVRKSGNFYILIHRKFPKIKNFQSLMDISSFEGRGIDKDIIEKIVDDINEEHKDFFEKIKDDYKDFVFLEEKRTIYRIIKIFGNFSLDSLEIEYKENLDKDIEIIKKFSRREFVKRLEKNFNEKNFLMAAKSALNNIPMPNVTVERIFKGQLSYGPRTELHIGEKNIVIQIEVNEFLAKFYPQKASDIITEIIRKVRKIEKYRIIGYNQTQIKKFIKDI